MGFNKEKFSTLLKEESDAPANKGFDKNRFNDEMKADTSVPEPSGISRFDQKKFSRLVGEETPDATILEIAKQRFAIGRFAVDRGRVGAKALFGDIDDESMLTEIESLESLLPEESVTPEFRWSDPKSIVANVIGSTAELLPFVGAAIKESVITGAKGALAGGVIGTGFAPGAGTVAGARTGFKLGWISGIIKISTEIEGGNLYADMIKDGVSSEVARAVAIATGVGIGILEVAGIGRLFKRIPGANKLLQKNITKAVVKNPELRASLVRAAGSFTSDIAFETGVEVVQEILSIGGELIAKTIEEARTDKEFKKPGLAESLERLQQVAAVTAQGTPLLVLPGVTVQVATERRIAGKLKQRKKAKDAKTALEKVIESDEFTEEEREAVREALGKEAVPIAGVDITVPEEIKEEVAKEFEVIQPPEQAKAEVEKELSEAPDPTKTTRADRFNSNFSPNQTLTPEEKEFETKTSEFFKNNSDEAINKYRERVKEEFKTDRVVSGDEAKFIAPDVNPNRMNAVHEPASALSKVFREELLADKSTADQSVVIMAGGSGSGKTSALRLQGEEKLNEFASIFDTNTNNLKAGLKSLGLVRKSGRNATFFYVEADPMVAWDRVIKRGIKSGRPVPVDIHVQNQGSRDAIKELHKQFKDNPNVNFVFIDNSGEIAKEISFDELLSVSYTSKESQDQLRGQLNERLRQKIESGEITEEQAAPFFSASERTRQDVSEERTQEPVGSEGVVEPVSAEEREREARTQEVISLASDLRTLATDVQSLVDLEAESLQEIGSGLSGGQLIKTQDGFKRTSLPEILKHPRTGNKPINAKQYRELAENNLEQGSGQFQQEYNEMTAAIDILESRGKELGLEAGDISKVATRKRLERLKNSIEIFEPQPLKPSEVKGQIREATGVSKEEEKVITERQALRESLKRQEKAAKDAERTGRKKAQEVAEVEISRLKDEIKARVPEKTALVRSLRRQAQAARKSSIETKKELQDVKQTLSRIIKDMLPLSEQGKLIAALAGVTTRPGMERIIDRIEEFATRIARQDAVKELRAAIKDIDVKKLRPEFRSKIEPIIQDLDPTRKTPKTLSRLENLLAFIQREGDHNIPASVLGRLDTLSKTPIDQLSTEEVRDITNTLNHLVKIHDLKNNLIIKGKLKSFFALRDEAVLNLKTKHEQKDGSVSGLDSFQQEEEMRNYGRLTGALGKIFTVLSYNPELQSEILDGGEKGPIWQIMYKMFDDGTNDQLRFEHSAIDFLQERIQGIDLNPQPTALGRVRGLNGKSWSKSFQKKSEDVESIEITLTRDRSIKMTRGERIAFFLHSLNESNAKHLLEGGFAFSATPSKIVSINETDLKIITSSLSEEEIQVARAFHEFYNTFQKDAINGVSVDLEGFQIATEPDYFPIRTNWLDRFKDTLIKKGSFVQKTLEGLGIFKERQNASNAIILEDAFPVWYKSMKQVASYVGLAKPLRNARMLLSDNEFQIAARGAGRNAYVESLKDFVDDMEGNAVQPKDVEKLTQNLINQMDISILGLNPFVAMKQPISFLLAGTEMDMRYLGQAAKTKVTQQIIEEMKKFHPQFRDRLSGNVTREMGELAEIGRLKKLFTGKEVLSNKFMAMIRRMDQEAVARIWIAAKLEVAETKPELSGNEFFEAVADRAWEVTRKTQPTFHIKDRSPIGRNRSTFIRLFTKYSSQRNKNYMILRRSLERYNRSEKTNADKAQLAKSMTLLVAVAPLLLFATDELRNFLYDRKQKESFINRLTTNFINVNFGNIYFLGPLWQSFISKVQRGTYAGYDVNDPLSSTIDQLNDSLAEAVRAVGQAITQEQYKSGKRAGELKWKHSLSKATRNAFDVVGRVKGIPIEQARRLIKIPIKVIKSIFG